MPYGVPKTANFAATSGSNTGVERRFFGGYHRFFAPVKEMGVHYKRIPLGILFIPHPSFAFGEIHLLLAADGRPLCFTSFNISPNRGVSSGKANYNPSVTCGDCFSEEPRT